MTDTKVRIPKATTLLRDDHRKVKKLFASYEKLESDSDSECDRLFKEIKTELTIHSRIEEEIFYPAVKMAHGEESKMLVVEALEEHKIAKTLLEEIDALDDEDHVECEAKMKVLRDSVLHHAEEEEKEIFPLFNHLDQDERDKVAEELLSRKRELKSEEEERGEG